MSADLSPAEQARAYREAADWLDSADDLPVHEHMIVICSGALRSEADHLDPPETVESLRAERDAALAEVERLGRDAEAAIRDHSAALDAIREDRDRVQHDLKGADYLITKLRDERDEARRMNVELRTCWEPAADAQSQRQPRVYRTGDPEPEGVRPLADSEGDVWYRDHGLWTRPAPSGETLRSWLYLTREYGPLTEAQ